MELRARGTSKGCVPLMTSVFPERALTLIPPSFLSPSLPELYTSIPQDTDILLTHGPPHGIGNLDRITTGQSVGCEELTSKLRRGELRPRLHCFGHIHGEQYLDALRVGQDVDIHECVLYPRQRPEACIQRLGRPRRRLASSTLPWSNMTCTTGRKYVSRAASTASSGIRLCN